MDSHFHRHGAGKSAVLESIEIGALNPIAALAIAKYSRSVIISKLSLKNWRNFETVEDIDLADRVFVVGPNAAGKSNFLDVFKFLRDLASPRGGGLQEAINQRGGVPKIRCLSARKETDIGITVELKEPGAEKFAWKYSIGIKLEQRGARKPYLKFESVWRDGESEPFLKRPSPDDLKDPERLTQTFLEQVNANAEFRPVVGFFHQIEYLHLVPQLIKHPEAFRGKKLAGDPFGMDFLESVAKTTPKTRGARLSKIDNALKRVVPQYGGLSFKQDELTGVPHLQVQFHHWRGFPSHQREDQFSDGTLRLIGLLWSLLSGDSLLLLEEPELAEYPRRRNGNLLFRIAVREVESWIMADRKAFAEFLGISVYKIPTQTDNILDPKKFLLDLARSSRKKDLRDDLVPHPGDSRRIGPDYNGRLSEFLHSAWQASSAELHSSSLAKTRKTLMQFHPIFPTRKN